MPDTFVPPKPPAAPSYQNREEATINRVQFEGNYSQRSGSGPNPWEGRVRLRFTQLSIAELNQIRDFIRPKKGRVAFLYQVPGTTSAELWTCPRTDFGLERNKTHWAISLDLIRENDL